MYQMEDGIGIGKLSEKKLLYRSRKNVCRKVHPNCFGNQPKSCEEPVVLQKPHKKTWDNTEPNINVVRGGFAAAVS